MEDESIASLVSRLYAALASGDRQELDAVLDPAFVGELSPGMPSGLGGRRVGAAAMRRDGWGAIGRVFAVAPHVEEMIPCSDGRLLVVGMYRGTARETGKPVEAGFTHLWASEAGRLTHLRQTTDTACWAAALADR